MPTTFTFTAKEIIEILTVIVAIFGGYLRLEKRISKLEVHDEDVWRNLMKRLGDELHQPHPEALEMDKLIEKYNSNTLSDEDLQRLKVLVDEKYAKARENGDKFTVTLALYVTGLEREEAVRRRKKEGIFPKVCHYICGGQNR